MVIVILVRSNDQIAPAEVILQVGGLRLVGVGGIDAGEELESGGVQLSAAFGDVVAEVLADSDMLVFLVEVVDVVAVYPTNYLQRILATLHSFSGDLSSVTEVVAHLDGYLVGDDLVGEHGDLLAQVDAHRFVVAQPPEYQFLYDLDRLQLDNSFCFLEEAHSVDQQVVDHRFREGQLVKYCHSIANVRHFFVVQDDVAVISLLAPVLSELNRINSTLKNFSRKSRAAALPIWGSKAY